MNVSPVLYHNLCRFCSANKWTTEAHVEGWICPRCLPAYRAGVEAMEEAAVEEIDDVNDMGAEGRIRARAARLLEEKPARAPTDISPIPMGEE